MLISLFQMKDCGFLGFSYIYMWFKTFLMKIQCKSCSCEHLILGKKIKTKVEVKDSVKIFGSGFL